MSEVKKFKQGELSLDVVAFQGSQRRRDGCVPQWNTFFN